MMSQRYLLSLFSAVLLSSAALWGQTASADTITVQSDATTLGAAMGAGSPSAAMEILLDNGDTTGLTFTPVSVGAFGTGTPVPPGAPAATAVVNIAPTDSENGFFETTFTLPVGFSAISLAGAANVDDIGRVFLNGNPISPSIFSRDPNTITEFGNATFATSNAAFFLAGTNVLLISDANTGAGPSGGAFYATITYTPAAVPEPGSVALLIGAGIAGAGFLARRKR